MENLNLVSHAEVTGRNLARVILFVSLAVVLIAVTCVSVALWNQGADKQKLAWAVATIFTVLAVPISSYDIQNHLLHFEIPELQKFIVRILFMVPIYSVTCWMCLGDESLYTFMEAFRSLYEAYTIWNFTYFLCGYLGPTTETLAARLAQKPQVNHIFPVNYILSPYVAATGIRSNPEIE